MVDHSTIHNASSIRIPSAVLHSPLRQIVSRVLCESVPQMYLQTSLLMALGNGLSSQPSTVFSVMLSVTLTGVKGLSLLKQTSSAFDASNYDRGWKEFCPAMCLSAAMCLSCSVLAVPALILLGFVGYIALRVVMVELCPSHIWNLTAGCLD